MTESELFAHYEKIYFYEQGRREQIFSRLNIPLAVMVAIVGFYAVIISSDYKSLELGVRIWFWLIFGSSVFCLLIGVYFFVEALLGRMDKAVATPNDLESWRQSLLKYYSDQSDCAGIVADAVRLHLYSGYMNCASIVTINNDRKASSLYFSNISVIVAVALSAVTYAIVKIPSL